MTMIDRLEQSIATSFQFGITKHGERKYKTLLNVYEKWSTLVDKQFEFYFELLPILEL
jgi:hypothetical protein